MDEMMDQLRRRVELLETELRAERLRVDALELTAIRMKRVTEFADAVRKLAHGLL